MATSRNEKARLRDEYRRRLTELKPEQRRREEAQTREAFFSSPLWRECRRLLGFLPMPHEFDSEPLYRRALAEGRELGLARVEGRALRFHRVASMDTAWDLHRFGMREPPRHLPELDLTRDDGEGTVLLVPGLVFDREGYRVGYGGGFYDRLLATLPPAVKSASLIYSLQLTERVPRETHDIAVGALLLPDGERPGGEGKKRPLDPRLEGSGA